jgi:hypothetical protein
MDVTYMFVPDRNFVDAVARGVAATKSTNQALALLAASSLLPPPLFSLGNDSLICDNRQLSSEEEDK